MKPVKRLLLGMIVVLSLAVIAASVGLMLYRGTPEWYHQPQMSPQQREAAAQSATNKLVMIQNEAARLRRDERRAARENSAISTTSPSIAITVSFTENELNAFFDKWAVWNDWKQKYQRHISEPVILLSDGRIIIAARVKELNTIASLHFEPRITEDGQLDLRLVRVLGGKLPLPQAAFLKYRRKLATAMAQNLPRWQQTATIDSSGTPNMSAVAAAMGSLALHVLDGDPADPVLFLPLVDANLRPRSVAVTLTEIRVLDHTLTLSVHPMNAQQRSALIRRIQEGASASAGE